MYTRGIYTGVLISIATYLLIHNAWDLIIYHAQFLVEAKSTDSIEAGPIKLTLSNATEWTTVLKMMVTILGTYLGIKVINKYV